MDATTLIVSAVRNMASSIAAILGSPADTTVTINGTTVFDEEVE